MARPSAGRSVRFMFRTIVIGYDGPGRGDEAVALAALLRDPARGHAAPDLRLPARPRPDVGGYVVPEEIDEAPGRDQGDARGGSRRDARQGADADPGGRIRSRRRAC